MNKRQKEEIDRRFFDSRREMFDLLVDIERAGIKTDKAVATNKDTLKALISGVKRLIDLSDRSTSLLLKIMAPFDNDKTNDLVHGPAENIPETRS